MCRYCQFKKSKGNLIEEFQWDVWTWIILRWKLNYCIWSLNRREKIEKVSWVPWVISTCGLLQQYSMMNLNDPQNHSQTFDFPADSFQEIRQHLFLLVFFVTEPNLLDSSGVLGLPSGQLILLIGPSLQVQSRFSWRCHIHSPRKADNF